MQTLKIQLGNWALRKQRHDPAERQQTPHSILFVINLNLADYRKQEWSLSHIDFVRQPNNLNDLSEETQ